MTHPQFISLKIITDSRRSLMVAEGESEIPFAIARVYHLFDIPAGSRCGFHAHRELRQVAVALRGQCDILLDDGQTREVCRLDTPSRGLLMDKMMWRELSDFSSDCLLAVFASAPYDESDYIRDYEEFLSIKRRQDNE